MFFLAVVTAIAARLMRLNRMKMEFMKISKSLKQLSFGVILAVLTAISFAGCESAKETPATTTASVTPAPPKAPVAPTPPTTPSTPVVTTPSVPAVPATPAATAHTPTQSPPVRIKAGAFSSFKDSQGNSWLPDQAFTGGDTIERPDLEIANTKDPVIYRAERYSMTGFSYPVPNGKYVVKLHFCETFEGIAGPGERVFSFNVQGHDFKDFDVWAKTGGHQRAYIETVPVEVTNGKLNVTFTPNVENPEINGIEILPAS
jgi:hypothetical protein